MDVLSARLRTWLLLAVALPAARMLVRRAADRARRRPDSATTTWLRRMAAQRQHRSGFRLPTTSPSVPHGASAGLIPLPVSKGVGPGKRKP